MSAFGLLLRSAWRFHMARPLELALCVLGLGLGVALVVSMDLSIDSARRGFAVSSDAVFGRSTHYLQGGVGGIDESLYARMRRDYAALPAAPVVQGALRFGDDQETVSLTLLGLDPFADGAFRDHAPTPGDDAGVALTDLLTVPGSIMASAETLQLLALDEGQDFEVKAAGRAVALRVLGEVRPSDRLSAVGLRYLLIADIATAQEVMKHYGVLSRIDLSARTPAQRALLQRLAEDLPNGVTLVSSASRSQAAQQMTAAFYLSLRMLSLLALVVGVFIIYNTMTFAVVRRRAAIGTLRALGVTDRGILQAVLSEGLALSVLGALVGIPLGLWLADELLGLVARTVDDLYFRTRVTTLFITPEVILRGIGCALLGGAVAALLPALEATRVPPRAAMLPSALEQRLRQLAPRLALAGGALLGIAALLVLVSGQSLPAAFASLFVLVLAGAALAPATVVLIGAAAAAIARGRVGRTDNVGYPWRGTWLEPHCRGRGGVGDCFVDHGCDVSDGRQFPRLAWRLVGNDTRSRSLCRHGLARGK